MSIRSFIEKLINVKNPGICGHLLLLPLTLCSFLFRCIVSMRTYLYVHSIMRRHSVPCSIITVGNITVGGTGKTPIVCHIARHLHDEGHRVAVLMRGYRGVRTDTPQLVSDGKAVLSDAVSAGDEALMTAEKLSGIPVLAGKDRVAAAHMAVQLFNVDIIVLDDGFQYHRLRRNTDVVLINARNPFGNKYLLPRGTLREPLSALKRAAVIVLTKSDISAAHDKISNTIKRYNSNALVFVSHYRPVGVRRVPEGRRVDLDALAGKRVAGLCSVGDPGSFFALLDTLQVELTEKIVFADHHLYQSVDYRAIQQRCGRSEFIITTEKDIAKIDLNMIDKEKFLVLEIEPVIENETFFYKSLKESAGIP